ncbi:hypothetical protein KIN20_005827 [Parelaphostrongylus tenuis]|uniref:Uncharacterized protein n=1 Tax=Parelaphostrongylus tenuis TaxID=148309 RepID=A0AAD5QHT6_PARTN|nr:hypothetical protein KIN20_005827 [Parelaphostrongylus tenuis]
MSTTLPYDLYGSTSYCEFGTNLPIRSIRVIAFLGADNDALDEESRRKLITNRGDPIQETGLSKATHTQRESPPATVTRELVRRSNLNFCGSSPSLELDSSSMSTTASRSGDYPLCYAYSNRTVASNKP